MLVTFLAALVLLVAIFAGVGVWIWGIYNRLVRLRNEVTNAWAQVETELERRLDMIPNIVNTVKGYASHERETLEAVIQARAGAMVDRTPESNNISQDLVTTSLGRLMALSERYPALKADQGFLKLQNELAETENRISFGRKVFNESVLIYNTVQQVFPANLVARKFGHSERTSFQSSASAARPPVVNF